MAHLRPLFFTALRRGLATNRSRAQADEKHTTDQLAYETLSLTHGLLLQGMPIVPERGEMRRSRLLTTRPLVTPHHIAIRSRPAMVDLQRIL